MKIWTHDELHSLLDNDPQLKARSEAIHALPEPASFDEAERQKLQMLELYAEAIGCRQPTNAQDACREVYSYLKTHFVVYGEGQTLTDDDWIAIGTIVKTYAAKLQCHTPQGNDFVCYCTNTQGV